MIRLLALIGLALPGIILAADWPHWRGPTRTGITDEDSGWTKVTLNCFIRSGTNAGQLFETVSSSGNGNFC